MCLHVCLSRQKTQTEIPTDRDCCEEFAAHSRHMTIFKRFVRKSLVYHEDK